MSRFQNGAGVHRTVDCQLGDKMLAGGKMAGAIRRHLTIGTELDL